MWQAAATGRGIGLLALPGQIEVPIHPVPVTMQTYVVLLVGRSRDGGSGRLSVLAGRPAGRWARGFPPKAHRAGFMRQFADDCAGEAWVG